MPVSAFSEIVAEAYGDAIKAYITSQGGTAKVCAELFGLEAGLYMAALGKLRRRGLIEPVERGWYRIPGTESGWCPRCGDPMPRRGIGWYCQSCQEFSRSSLAERPARVKGVPM